MAMSAARVALWRRLFGSTSKSLLRSFKAFHEENPHIYAEFARKAVKVALVHDKYSPWVIINVIRWNHDLRTSGKHFKISNDHIACYSRLFIWRNPEYEGLFNLKSMKPRRRVRSNTR